LKLTADDIVVFKSLGSARNELRIFQYDPRFEKVAHPCPEVNMHVIMTIGRLKMGAANISVEQTSETSSGRRSNMCQAVDNNHHNLRVMNRRLSQTFRESIFDGA
jgi:hypothetical protein